MKHLAHAQRSIAELLPAYPPPPWHLTGFDAILSYVLVEEPDAARSCSVLETLYRESVRRGAKRSAAKALRAANFPSGHGDEGCRVLAKLVAEAPEPSGYFWLSRAESKAGKPGEAARDARNMLRVATRVGDLDAIEVAKRVLRGETRATSRTFSRRIGRASHRSRPAKSAYAALHRLKREALGRGGWATALECVRRMMLFAAVSNDMPAGVRFAREHAALETSSFSSLAVAFAHERMGDVEASRAAFAETVRQATAEGDIHRATKGTAGLLRVGGERLVTKAELRWALADAENEATTTPDHVFLLANLGRPYVFR